MDEREAEKSDMGGAIAHILIADALYGFARWFAVLVGDAGGVRRFPPFTRTFLSTCRTHRNSSGRISMAEATSPLVTQAITVEGGLGGLRGGPLERLFSVNLSSPRRSPKSHRSHLEERGAMAGQKGHSNRQAMFSSPIFLFQ